MTTFDHVAIMGLGLIGGSMARDFAALGVRISAFDPDATHLAAALRTNVIHGALDDSLEGLHNVDAIIIATPVDTALDVLRRIASRGTRAKLITDVGSTKARIVDLASELGLGERFVGGHPMCGDHRSGWEASRTGLFSNARVFLCPTRDTTAAAKESAHAVWKELGARPEEIDSEEHDLKMAWRSHLPHLVSAALALALSRAGVGRSDLGSGGRDMTRLAGSSPEMWTAIAIENAAAVELALREAEREIATFRAAVQRADAQKLRDRFALAREWFDR
jgi:prephenate dehydrogenase